MDVIVQKFGGTSVASELGWVQVEAKVRQAQAQGFAPVLVVSAMGRYPAPYATDSLLALIAPYQDVTLAPERDMLMGCGEIISTVVLSHFLRSRGIAAQGFSGPRAGVLTDAAYTEAQIEAVNPTNLLRALNEGQVPVVAGFQGLSPQHRVVTLGRGGSDTTAVALGVALQAKKVEIYTDVDGIMTADPRWVEEAQVLRQMTYTEIGEMAKEGARVLHPRAAGMAAAHKLPLVVRSTFSNQPGTLLVPDSSVPQVTVRVAGQAAGTENIGGEGAHAEDVGVEGACAKGVGVGAGVAVAESAGANVVGANVVGTDKVGTDKVGAEDSSSANGRVAIVDRVAGRGQVATGVVTVPGRCAINVDLAWAPDYTEARLRVLESMAQNQVSLDMINVVGNHLYFLINQSDMVTAREYLRDLGYGFTVCQNCAKVSVVGHNMRGVPGVMRRICRALASESVRLLYATDSHITISCVVPEDQLHQAAASLHREFALELL